MAPPIHETKDVIMPKSPITSKAVNNPSTTDFHAGILSRALGNAMLESPRKPAMATIALNTKRRIGRPIFTMCIAPNAAAHRRRAKDLRMKQQRTRGVRVEPHC
jgi:hypothetical protein